MKRTLLYPSPNASYSHESRGSSTRHSYEDILTNLGALDEQKEEKIFLATDERVEELHKQPVYQVQRVNPPLVIPTVSYAQDVARSYHRYGQSLSLWIADSSVPLHDDVFHYYSRIAASIAKRNIMAVYPHHILEENPSIQSKDQQELNTWAASLPKKHWIDALYTHQPQSTQHPPSISLTHVSLNDDIHRYPLAITSLTMKRVHECLRIFHIFRPQYLVVHGLEFGFLSAMRHLVDVYTIDVKIVTVPIVRSVEDREKSRPPYQLLNVLKKIALAISTKQSTDCKQLSQNAQEELIQKGWKNVRIWVCAGSDTTRSYPPDIDHITPDTKILSARVMGTGCFNEKQYADHIGVNDPT